MKHFWAWLSAPLLVLGLTLLVGWHNRRERSNLSPMDYSVRLVRADNSDLPADRALTPLPGRLESQFRQVFGWQRFWEVCRRQVRQGGDLTRIRLNPTCEVEIEAVSPAMRETRIYVNGTLTSRSRHPMKLRVPAINGGANEDGSAWFVVVEDQAPDETPVGTLAGAFGRGEGPGPSETMTAHQLR